MSLLTCRHLSVSYDGKAVLSDLNFSVDEGDYLGIVGDRFPFLYFAKEFGLTYYAAFPGCSTDTEANPATIAFLVDKVKADHIPVVFHIEMSNEQMSKAIAEATGAKNELLNAVHNVSDEEFKKGVTYIDLMNHNVKVLKEALN